LDAGLPLVRRQCPDVGLDILGANPPPDLVARGSNGGDIRIPGYVADPGPFLATAGVFVVPLLAGGGMRVKILTAMAQGLPVVTTSVGCEGIDLVPGRHALVADSPEGFAAAMLRVLAQPRLAEDLSLQGRRFVEQRYSLPQLAGELREVYTALVGTRA
jgi:glycosyltransferase involved in cell wall biosynthesis